MRRRLLGSAAAVTAAALAIPPAASAHGLVGREDLPIPSWLFGWAAAAVLVVSFVGLAVLWPKPRLDQPDRRRVVALPRWLEPLCGALGVLAFAALVFIGLAGSQVPLDNLVPTVVYVVFWVALVPISALFGNVWAAFNPWLAVGRAASWAGSRLGLSAGEPMAYPERLGHWPAVAGLAGFGVLELVFTDRDDPSTLAVLALVYAAVQLVGMALYGVRAWTERADGFSVYFGLVATLSPLEVRDGVLYRRRWLSGVFSVPQSTGIVALLVVAVGITTFDGASEGPLLMSVLPGLQELLNDAGMTARQAGELAWALGLIVCIAVVGAWYVLGIRGMHDATRTRSTGELARRFAMLLTPIAVAYAVAHYVSFLAYQTQAIPALVSDPLGDGRDLLGAADWSIDYTFLSATAIWYIQVAALLAGHVVALVIAHDRALTTFRDARAAVRSQYWMLGLTVGFTSLGLWLLSAANG